MNKNNRETNKIIPLEWDSRFFGVPIGRIYADGLTEAVLKNGLQRAGEENIEFVELFCDACDDESIAASQKLDFRLADLRMTLKKALEPGMRDPEVPGGLIFRKAGKEDIEELKKIGKGIFKDSRYYRYENFARDTIDLLFQLWIEKSVHGRFDDEVYCLTGERDILAFCTLKYSGDIPSIGLYAINSAHQGKGLGSLVFKKSLYLFYRHGVKEVVVVTQGRNTGAMRLYQKNGFWVAGIALSYYKWLD